MIAACLIYNTVLNTFQLAVHRQTEAVEDHRADRGHGTALKSCAAPAGAAGLFGARHIDSRDALTTPRLGFCTAPALLSNLKVQ
jgi:hypothetical protein